MNKGNRKEKESRVELIMYCTNPAFFPLHLLPKQKAACLTDGIPPNPLHSLVPVHKYSIGKEI